MARAAAPRTVMISDLDSVLQKHLWLQRGRVDALAQLKGCLRLSDLMGATTVLPFVNVFDGVFFLALGPEGVAHVLGLDPGTNLPLSVSFIRGSAEAEVATRRAEPTFEWSSNLLLDDGWSQDRLDAQRDAWVAAVAAHQLDVTPIDTSNWSRLFTEELDKLGRPDFVPQTFVDELRSYPKRSDAFRRIEEDYGADEEIGLGLKQWWTDPYTRALARQHGASVLSTVPGGRPDGDGASARVAAIPRPKGTAVVGKLLDDLTEMPAVLYPTLRWRTKAVRQEWARTDTENAFRSLAVACHQLLGDEGASWRRTIWMSVTKAVALVVLAALTILSVFVSWQWLLAVPVVSVLLSDVPWALLGEIRDWTPGRLRAVVDLEVGEHGEP